MAKNFNRDVRGVEIRVIDPAEVERQICEAEIARRLRLGRLVALRAAGDADQPIADHRIKATETLGRSLLEPLAPVVDGGGYLNRVASLSQMSSGVVQVLMTSAPRLRMVAPRARALAVALSEVVHFVVSGVAKDDGVTIQLVIAKEPGRLVIGIAASGGFQPIAPAEATAALLRARAIVEAMGGDFERGVDAERMVFGFTIPYFSRPRSTARFVLS